MAQIAVRLRHFPWPQIGILAIALIAAGAIVYSVIWAVSRGGENTSAPTVPIVQQPAVQPVQQVPQNVQENVAVVPAKVHVEWTKIGTARNGDEVVALQIPWDELIYVPVELIENLPPGVTGIAGGIPTDRGTIILVTLAQTAPWVYTYWEGSEIPISYAPEPWVYTQRGK